MYNDEISGNSSLWNKKEIQTMPHHVRNKKYSNRALNILQI